jgi:hypothetical protein
MLGYYLKGRRFEWVITVAMLWLAAAIVISPDIVLADTFQLIAFPMSAAFVAVILFGVGLVRLIGLVLNGHEIAGRRAGPMIRAAMAIACAVMWAQIDLALIQLSFKHGLMSPDVPFWSMIVLGEIDVAYRAVADHEGSS